MPEHPNEWREIDGVWHLVTPDGAKACELPDADDLPVDILVRVAAQALGACAICGEIGGDRDPLRCRCVLPEEPPTNA